MATTYLDLLAGSFARALEMQRYAEAKNVALLTFSSAGAVLIATLIAATSVPDPLKIAGSVTSLCLWASSLISVWSLLPRFRSTTNTDPTASQNLLHFDNLRHLDTKSASDLLAARYRAPTGELTEHYSNDLAQQIIVNSQIARRKFVLSDWSATLVVAGIILAPATLLLAQLFIA